MKKRFAIIAAIALAVVGVLAFAVPALAAKSSSTQPAAATKEILRPMVLVRLMLIRDEAQVDALIARAKDAGKITDAQAVKIKEFWTEHHKQFTKNVILTRIIWAQDGAKVQSLLDKAVAAGKLRQAQADKIMGFWKSVHT